LPRTLRSRSKQKQELLEAGGDIRRAAGKIYGFMEGEIGVLQVEKRIRNRVKRQMEKTQREYYLNEQMKAIQKELAMAKTASMNSAKWKENRKCEVDPSCAKKAEHELKKLRQMSRCRPKRRLCAITSTGF
jgi:ATP-dependent Lon protease